jgi:hypothetical protein
MVGNGALNFEKQASETQSVSVSEDTGKSNFLSPTKLYNPGAEGDVVIRGITQNGRMSVSKSSVGGLHAIPSRNYVWNLLGQ